MRRYLLVLNMDLPDDEHLASYLAARQEQEPHEVVVLSLPSARQLPLAVSFQGLRGRPMSDVGAPRRPFVGAFQDGVADKATERRMSLAVHALKAHGCQARGIIGAADLVKAVRSETRRNDYDEVILVASSQDGSWLKRALGRDPVHRLRRHLKQRLIVFRPGLGAPQCEPQV